MLQYSNNLKCQMDGNSKTSGFQLWFMTHGSRLHDYALNWRLKKLCDERFMVNMIQAILSH